MPGKPSVLDPRQLERIEGVHRGFLYQHLYAVGCLLVASKVNATAVIVEHDEDLEVQLIDQRVYIQVKTRSAPLVPSDIIDVLERFEALRAAHMSECRSGAASFRIISNQTPSPSLIAKMKSGHWPADVTLHWPGGEGLDEPMLPPAWVDAQNAVTWCSEFASTLPFATLIPETLVWKLAGCVALASSGASPYEKHSFEVATLSTLFEQIVFRLQDFPVVPPHYRPQTNEPSLISELRVRMICGFSGAGKTAWASQSALHIPYAAAYFDVADVPGPTVAASLVRELAGRLLGTTKGRLGEILLPGASGIEMLRLLDCRLDHEAIDAVVVIDNAHRVPPEDLRSLIEATSRLRLVFLCQPNAEMRAIQTTLGILDESLAGWTEDTIAIEAAESDCRANYATCNRLIRLTGGLPLYVQSSVRVAASAYGGDLGHLCADIESQTHLVATPQEIILGRLYETLTLESKDILAVLSIVECPLSKNEASVVIERVLGLIPSEFAKIVRNLTNDSFIQIFGNSRLKVHDTIRVFGLAHLTNLGEAVKQVAYATLSEVLATSLREERDILRFAPFIRLLGLAGDVETLVDLANDELFHEMGLSGDFEGIIEETASKTDSPPVLRFWALDALAFAELKKGDMSRLPSRLRKMKHIIEENSLGQREVLALGMKRMLFAAKHGNEENFEIVLDELRREIPDDPAFLRILKYNAACAKHMIGQYSDAKDLSLELIEEYYDHLGLDIGDVFAKNPEDIWPLLKKTDTITDDLKHLADCLDLSAKTSTSIGEDSGLARIHAFKFYAMVNAIDSAIKVGQDLVDEFLSRNDPVGARQILEGCLLPAAIRAKMLDRIVPLRGQYAVVLARCGNFQAAEAEMRSLASYESGLPVSEKDELQRQRILIGNLRNTEQQRLLMVERETYRKMKIGRNEPCPCGSGKKFKKCHGAGN